VEIEKRLVQTHEDIVEFGSNLQKASDEKKTRENHIGNNVYGAFYKINAFAITLHRAVLSLCENGWCQTTPLLLRTIIESSASCLAIANSDYPEYMAFKYLYSPYLETAKDKAYPNDLKEKNREDIEAGLKRIEDVEIRTKAETYVNTDPVPNRWYKPEFKSISAIIAKYGGDDMSFIYAALSTAVHGYHFGMGLFKDNSDAITINPEENPTRSKSAILLSCRHLLEHLYIRDQNEELGFGEEYKRLLAMILSFKEEIIEHKGEPAARRA